MSDSTVKTIAASHGKTAAQVCLRWVIQRGAVIASGTGADPTKATAYTKENLDIFRFSLTNNEMDALDKLSSS